MLSDARMQQGPHSLQLSDTPLERRCDSLNASLTDRGRQKSSVTTSDNTIQSGKLVARLLGSWEELHKDETNTRFIL